MSSVLHRAARLRVTGPMVMMLGLLGLMTALTTNYLSGPNILMVVKVFTVTGLIGCSQMIILAAGGLNISVGAVGALSAIIAGGAMDRFGAPPYLSLLLGLTVGMLCGLLNGALIYRLGGVSSAFFLITLATASLYQGINLTITSGTPFYGIDPGFFRFGDYTLFGLPLSFYYMVFIYLFVGHLFSRLSIGRQILAFGANPRAAEIYGISKLRVVVFANVAASLIAAFAGMIALIRIKTAQPNMGADWMLLSFAAPLIGGTKLTGGTVNVLGCALGALSLTIISNGLVHLGVDVFWNTFIYGTVILLTVLFERLRVTSLGGGAWL